MEKLACPATSPKCAPPGETTVRVTGTVMLGVPAKYSAKIICPLSVPALSVDALTETTTDSGVAQQPPPVGLAVSQLPPVDVEGVTLKANCVPVLEIATTCGSGFAPPAAMVNDSAGTL
jgi:hypothetical protein